MLRAGDTLLLQGTWKALDVHLDDPDVLMVNSPETRAPASRATWRRRDGGHRALLGMVVLLALGLVPPAVAALLAAGALVLTTCDRRAGLSVDQLDDGHSHSGHDAALDGHDRRLGPHN